MKHELLLEKNYFKNRSNDISKKQKIYESSLVGAFDRIRKLKNLQKFKNDKNISDIDFYNKYYKGVYAVSYYDFIETYKNLYFKSPKEQTLPVQIVAHYLQSQGHVSGNATFPQKYYVNLRVIAGKNFKVEEKTYTIEEVENLISSNKIFAHNWFTGKLATEEEFKKYNNMAKLSTLYFDSQRQYKFYQDFNDLSLYPYVFNLVRETLSMEQINKDLNEFIKEYEDNVKSTLEKNEKEKVISIKRHYTNKLKRNEEIINLSNNALETLNDLQKE